MGSGQEPKHATEENRLATLWRAEIQTWTCYTPPCFEHASSPQSLLRSEKQQQQHASIHMTTSCRLEDRDPNIVREHQRKGKGRMQDPPTSPFGKDSAMHLT
mmetsp:Transcript_55527/g.129236  ORF Transcript_55527/g.129236 Transcript_55527/m.129236 type:complete len:102 (-) Transcript_55527:21-326(-)